MSLARRRSVPSDQRGVPERDELGQPICRWCKTPVRPPRRTFCSDACVHEWRIRSDPGYVRQHIWKRDAGICRLCQTNVGKAERHWRRQRPKAGDRTARRRWRQQRPRWEADHVLPVADGGGECGLGNYRLLCRRCHVIVTLAWRRKRATRARVASEDRLDLRAWFAQGVPADNGLYLRGVRLQPDLENPPEGGSHEDSLQPL